MLPLMNGEKLGTLGDLSRIWFMFEEEECPTSAVNVEGSATNVGAAGEVANSAPDASLALLALLQFLLLLQRLLCLTQQG